MIYDYFVSAYEGASNSKLLKSKGRRFQMIRQATSVLGCKNVQDRSRLANTR